MVLQEWRRCNDEIMVLRTLWPHMKSDEIPRDHRIAGDGPTLHKLKKDGCRKVRITAYEEVTVYQAGVYLHRSGPTCTTFVQDQCVPCSGGVKRNVTGWYHRSKGYGRGWTCCSNLWPLSVRCPGQYSDGRPEWLSLDMMFSYLHEWFPHEYSYWRKKNVLLTTETVTNKRQYYWGAWVAQWLSHLPLAQGVILGSWDQALHWGPRRKSASSSACVSASLSVSLMNK